MTTYIYMKELIEKDLESIDSTEIDKCVLKIVNKCKPAFDGLFAEKKCIFYEELEEYIHEHFENMINNLCANMVREIAQKYHNNILGEFDGKRMRETILEENKDELINDINKDLLDKVEDLEKELKFYTKERE